MIARLRSDPTPLRKMRRDLEFPEAVEEVLRKATAAESGRPVSDDARVRRCVHRAAAGGATSGRRRGWHCSASCSVGEHDVERVGRCARFGRRGRSSVIARSASAQQVRPYQPGVRRHDYAIAIDLPDTGATIRASATLTRHAHATRDTLVLDLLDLTVNGVTVDGRAVQVRRGPGDDRDSAAGEAGTRVRRTASRIDYGGAVDRRADRARRQRRTVDVLRRQLAESRAPLDSEHRSSERQGDGDVARDGARRRRPSSANGKLVSTRTIRARRRRTTRNGVARSRGAFRCISW